MTWAIVFLDLRFEPAFNQGLSISIEAILFPNEDQIIISISL